MEEERRKRIRSCDADFNLERLLLLLVDHLRILFYHHNLWYVALPWFYRRNLGLQVTALNSLYAVHHHQKHLAHIPELRIVRNIDAGFNFVEKSFPHTFLKESNWIIHRIEFKTRRTFQKLRDITNER